MGTHSKNSRPRRIPDDGVTTMQRAQELKKLKNLEQGNKLTTSFAFESNDTLLSEAQSVNILLGIDTMVANKTIDLMKEKELMDRVIFEDNNPDVSLPSDLHVDMLAEDFPPLINRSEPPLKGAKEGVEQA
jgi:hypothetical protein